MPSTPITRFPVNYIAMLERTQTITSDSIQQVVEGLCGWKDARMICHSKNWPVFDGQIFTYIA
jgi:hypothetical protein